MNDPVCHFCGNPVFLLETPHLRQKASCPECGELLDVTILEPIWFDYHADTGKRIVPDYYAGTGINPYTDCNCWMRF